MGRTIPYMKWKIKTTAEALKILHHHRPIRTVHVHVGDPDRGETSIKVPPLFSSKSLKHFGMKTHGFLDPPF